MYIHTYNVSLQNIVGRTEEWKDRQTDEWKDGETDEWKDGETDEWKDGETDRWHIQTVSSCTNCFVKSMDMHGQYCANNK